MSDDIVRRWEGLIHNYIPAMDELHQVKGGLKKPSPADYKELLERYDGCLADQFNFLNEVKATQNESILSGHLQIDVSRKMDMISLDRQLICQPSTSQVSGNDQFGIYQSPEGEWWIDGSWEIAYGHFQGNDRNARVEAAKQAYPTAKLHNAPQHVPGWMLVG